MIRNIDKKAYRALKARAALEGKTIGEILNEAISAYLSRRELMPKGRSLQDLVPVSFPEGNERLSEEIDAIVYGGHIGG